MRAHMRVHVCACMYMPTCACVNDAMSRSSHSTSYHLQAASTMVAGWPWRSPTARALVCWLIRLTIGCVVEIFVDLLAYTPQTAVISEDVWAESHSLMLLM